MRKRPTSATRKEARIGARKVLADLFEAVLYSLRLQMPYNSAVICCEVVDKLDRYRESAKMIPDLINNDEYEKVASALDKQFNVERDAIKAYFQERFFDMLASEYIEYIYDEE